MHGGGQGASDHNIVEFNTGEVLNFKFQSERTGVLTDGNGQRALLGAGWVGVQSLTEGHHLLATDLVGFGVVLARFEFVNGNMLATEVGGVDVVEEHVDVVDAVIGRWVVDGQGSLHVLLDDVSISIEGRRFNLVKCSFELVPGNGFNLSTASNRSTCLLTGQVRWGEVWKRSIRCVTQ